MATEAQILANRRNAQKSTGPRTLSMSLGLAAAKRFARTSAQGDLFMQNKANLLDAQMNISSVLTKDYENKPLRRRGENKPNQTQSPRPRFYPKNQHYPRKDMPKKPQFPPNPDNFNQQFSPAAACQAPYAKTKKKGKGKKKKTNLRLGCSGRDLIIAAGARRGQRTPDCYKLLLFALIRSQDGYGRGLEQTDFSLHSVTQKSHFFKVLFGQAGFERIPFILVGSFKKLFSLMKLLVYMVKAYAGLKHF